MRNFNMALAMLLSFFAVTAQAEVPGSTLHQGYIPMEDGITLAYQVVTPDPEKFGPGPYPALVDYSGYGPGRTVNYNLDERFVTLGYALVGVNMRGTGCSGGVFDFFDDHAGQDGAAAIEWLGEQDWSNGRFGMVNKSFPGITQWYVAQYNPKGLVAITPGHSITDIYRDTPFPGGILNYTFAALWSFVVQPAPGVTQTANGVTAPDTVCTENQADHATNPRFNPFVQAVERRYDDELFRARSVYNTAQNIRVPYFMVETWQDEQVGSRAMHILERIPESVPGKVVASNGKHNEYYDDASIQEGITRFFHYFVKQEVWPADDLGDGYEAAFARYKAEPKVQIHWEQSESASQASWKTGHDAFPPSDHVIKRFYLAGDGRLRHNPVQEGPESSSYVYDTAGTHNQIWSTDPAPIHHLTFTTSPLEQDYAVLGPGSADLYLSSIGGDSDLQIMLTEVTADNEEIYVQRGWLRVSQRKLDPERSTELRPWHTHLESDAVLVPTPGEVMPLRVEIFPVGHIFRAGSSLRMYVEAPSTISGLWGFTAKPDPAENTLYHSEEYPSSLALAVLPNFVVEKPAGDCYDIKNQPCRDNPTDVPAKDSSDPEPRITEISSTSSSGPDEAAPNTYGAQNSSTRRGGGSLSFLLFVVLALGANWRRKSLRRLSPR